MNLKIYDSKDFPAYLPKLNLLYDDLFGEGKGFRSKLVKIVAEPIKVPEETTHLLCQTIEFIHNASLLHDDLIDRSQLRRGKPAAWTKYSPEYAVLAGDYLLARVMVNLSSHGNIKLVQYTSEIISDLLEGEWLQDSVVGDFFVTLEQLDRIHNLKTASLFKWCLRSPFIAQNKNDEVLHQILEEMGTFLGQLFQRSDDLLDYNVRNSENKAILGDLKSGYLNSFGSFVVQKMNKKQIDQLIRSQNLDEFEKSMLAVDPKLTLSACVEQFDQLNQRIIDLYFHHLKELSVLLNLTDSGQSSLFESLRMLPEVLYWRKKP
jgi:octaprenyl-diphosphate synthase